MLTTKVACPRCQRSLKAPRALSAGSKITCPGCRTLFEITADGPRLAAPRSPILCSLPAPTAVKESSSSDWLRKESLPTSPPVAVAGVSVRPPTRSHGWVVAGLLGLALLFLLTISGLTVLLNLKSDPPGEQVATTPPGAEPAAAPEEPSMQEAAPPTPEPDKRPLNPHDPPSNQPEPDAGRDRPGDAKPPTTLTAEEQARINKAIDQGVRYLRGSQTTRGPWSSRNHIIGYTALPGLTLLECGVPATDPAVQRAAAYVRENYTNLISTYELSLAVLFLDRLGDSRDRGLIQTLSLRLVAGQKANGGWTYTCPLLDDNSQRQLLTALQELSQQTSLEQFRPLMYAPANQGEWSPVRELSQGPSGPEPASQRPPPARTPQQVMADLPRTLKSLPVLQELGQLKDERADTDNSNTQFAILALWAARRYEVPMERTVALIVKRFRTSQNRDGSWDYRYVPGGNKGPGRNTMDCVGLLGLAVGHGILHDLGQGKSSRSDAARPSVQDAQIQKGFEALSRHIGEPAGRPQANRQQNLYFLWSVERVGVLYDVATIGGKDWYRWGAEILCASQQTSGSWHNGRYNGSDQTLDTCLALLFLRRANLAQDLTRKLELLAIEK